MERGEQMNLDNINLLGEEFKKEKQILHDEYIEFIKSNYLRKDNKV